MMRLALLALALLAVPRLAAADEDAAGLKRGKIALRGRASLDANQTIRIGGQSTGARVGGGADIGVSYFFVDNLSFDVDLGARFLLVPETDLTSLGVTPGVSWYPVPQFYARVGAPIVFIPSFNVGVLGGVGLRQRLGSKVYFLAGVDYTYWLTETFRASAPGGQIDISVGLQTSF